MTARIIGGVTVDLNDGPIRTGYSRDADGKQRAVLIIGTGSNEIGITVTGSSPDLLAQLEIAASELRAWLTLQQLTHLPEVA